MPITTPTTPTLPPEAFVEAAQFFDAFSLHYSAALHYAGVDFAVFKQMRLALLNAAGVDPERFVSIDWKEALARLNAAFENKRDADEYRIAQAGAFVSDLVMPTPAEEATMPQDEDEEAKREG